MKTKYFFLIIFLLVLVTSCEQEDPETTYTSTYPLNGEYWVRFDAATITGSDTTWEVDPYGIGYAKILLSNTASDMGDSIWIDDFENFWAFKVKAACNVKARTFNVDNGYDLYHDDTTTIKNGKLILNGGVTKSGNKVDSIHMHVMWVSDPGTLYRFSGVRRTGFLEDEY